MRPGAFRDVVRHCHRDGATSPGHSTAEHRGGHRYNIALALPDEMLASLEADVEDSLLRLANAITSSVLEAKDRPDFERRPQGRKLADYLHTGGSLPNGLLYMQVTDRDQGENHDWGISSGMMGDFQSLEPPAQTSSEYMNLPVVDRPAVKLTPIRNNSNK